MAAPCVDVLGPVAQGLLDCVVDTLVECGAPVVAAFVSPGIPAADFCCEDDREAPTANGMAWVQLVSIVPDPSPAGWRCQSTLTATLRVGLLRCVRVMDEHGNGPAPGDIDEDGLMILRDAALLRQAVVCCWPSRVVEFFPRGIGNDSWSLGTWQSVDSLGGCAGGALTVTFQYSDCACP